MRITLSTWERVQLIQVVASGRGTIGQVELGLQALAVLRLSDEEKQAVEWVEVGPNQIAWMQSVDCDLEFGDDVWQLVQGFVLAYQGWPVDERVKPLCEKVSPKATIGLDGLR